MTEKDKFLKRMFDDPNKKLLNFGVSWGPDAYKLTAEERYKALNDVFEAVENGDYEVLGSLGDSKRPQINMKDFPDNPKGTTLINVIEQEKNG